MISCYKDNYLGKMKLVDPEINPCLTYLVKVSEFPHILADWSLTMSMWWVGYSPHVQDSQNIYVTYLGIISFKILISFWPVHKNLQSILACMQTIVQAKMS